MIYNTGCWMCGREANSREHRYKKTDLKRLFSPKNKHTPYSSKDLPLSVSFAEGAGTEFIKGPDASNQKYPPMICLECNNRRTQGMDNAYDKLSTWCWKNPRASYFNLKEIWGDDYISQLSNFYGYLLKVLGCEILNSGFSLPADFPNPLEYQLENSTLRITICKSANWSVFFPSTTRSWHETLLGKGTLWANVKEPGLESSEIKSIAELVWFRQIGNYQINFWYNTHPPIIFGKPLDGSLPIYVTPDTRLDYLDMEYVFSSIVSKKDHLTWLTEEAEKGNIYAQYKLGLRYALGNGTKKDLEKAEAWLTLAAEADHEPAQDDLGLLYYSGAEQHKNINKIFQLWEAAANQGYAPAQNNLGVLYSKGLGVLQDYCESVKWYKHSAWQRYSHAQYNLGNMYFFGRGVERSEINASVLWNLAANKGHLQAKNNIEWLRKKPH